MISNETSISHEDVKIEEKDNKEPPKEPEDEKKDNFECNICFDSAENPVVTLCGHLFCWTCLHKWIDSQTNSLLVCPVCKAGIKHENIIPIYGRGGNNEAKKNIPQENTPERPRGQRPEPTRNPNYVPNQPTMFGGSLHFGFGAGGFHFGDGFPLPGDTNLRHQNNENIDSLRETLKRFLLALAILVFLSICLY